MSYSLPSPTLAGLTATWTDNPPDSEAEMWALLKPLQDKDLLEDVRPEFKIVGEVLSEYSY